MEYQIENIESFEFELNQKLREFEKFFIKKDVFDLGVINNSNDDYIEYYKRKKSEVINMINHDTFVLRFSFEERIVINKEDFEQLLVVPLLMESQIELYKNLSRSSSEPRYLDLLSEELKQLKDYLLQRLKDIDLSLKLSYYNERLKFLGIGNTGKVLYNTNYLNLFNKWGFELFEYLNKKFVYINAPTTKFTILYFFLLEKGFINCYKSDYLKFVRSNCKSDLNGRKFSRFSFDDYTKGDSIYSNNEQELTELYKEFKRAHNF